MNEMESLGSQIKREESRTDPRAGVLSFANAAAPQRFNRSIVDAGGTAITQRGNRSRYAELFSSTGLELSDHGFQSFSDWAMTMRNNPADPRIQKLSMDTGGTNTTSFLVPSAFSAEILDQALEQEIIRPRARVIPMTTPELKMPGFDNSDRSAGLLKGGWNPTWLGESEQASETDPKFYEHIALS